jgi:hypothetical protein
MEQSRFDRIEQVEVQISDTSTLKWKIGDRDNLRDVLVNAVQVIPVSKASRVPISDNAVVNNTIFLKSTLTLSVDGEESIDSVPLTVFNPADNDGRLFVFSVPKRINWEKSYFQISNSTGQVANESFLMVVFYEKNK